MEDLKNGLMCLYSKPGVGEGVGIPETLYKLIKSFWFRMLFEIETFKVRVLAQSMHAINVYQVELCGFECIIIVELS